ncbi:MAG: cobyrinic acid a,c-diamide synthase [Dyadobacter sp. 50-39]|uniref:cobyrinate a,c-diamide synthase n=1 Tax=Dyadobacter sp. 50-39 TaxID=1895756 RepID=UPI0009658E82|nr:cobyrinate a,c-diamide synthase [Dyadobacter sp. 50-39]OJV12374.1 MAG: cobyrinic acid a,c-diamide synthase [Dyadobacter sp. 50-39]
MSVPQSRFLISAPSSNSGKTTLTLGLLRALRERGLAVQPFKCGPDYIDTIHHTAAAGRTSLNLDTFMASEAHMRAVYAHYAAHADVSVTEGVMGLFDGADKMKGSSAEIAALLDIPVVLVMNARSMAYSAAPLIYGLKNFHSGIRVVGVIFNFVNTESHYRFLQEACTDAGVEALGYLPKNEALHIPSRHLGLHISAETDYEQIIQRLAELIPRTVNLDRLLEITAVHADGTDNASDDRVLAGPIYLSQLNSKPLRITVARDEAFSFLYHQNIECLRAFGEVQWVSLLHDRVLPETDLLYLPGGYPELFARQLAENQTMLESIRNYCFNDGVAYAECGGLMYLARELVDGKGNSFEMAGVLDLATTMQHAKMTLGYRVMHWDGLEIKGHEFHYSGLKDALGQASLAQMTNARGMPVDTQLFRVKNTFAAYTHLYWADQPGFIQQLINQTTKSADGRQPKAHSLP